MRYVMAQKSDEVRTTINHPFPNPLTQRVELTLKGELVPIHTVRMTDTNS